MSKRTCETICIVPNYEGCFVEGSMTYIAQMRAERDGMKQPTRLRRVLLTLAEHKMPGYRRRIYNEEIRRVSDEVREVQKHNHVCLNCPARNSARDGMSE